MTEENNGWGKFICMTLSMWLWSLFIWILNEVNIREKLTKTMNGVKKK